MDFFSRGYSALRDRRAGVLSLKGLVKDLPEKVGDKSLPALIKVLHAHCRDVDITKSLLETLTILCTKEKQDTEGDKGDNSLTTFYKNLPTLRYS
ncbi:unnamed protein product [Absidia cylindrospora]